MSSKKVWKNSPFSESTWPGVFPEKALDPFYSQKIKPISLPQEPTELKRFLKKNKNSVYQGYNIHKRIGGLKSNKKINEPFTSNKVDDISFSTVMLIKDAKLPNEVTLGQIKKLVK